MTFLLGIDGGGTGCRAVLADRAGRVLGRGAAGPANVASDPEGACANILAASRMAIAAAGVAPDLSGLAAGLGLAGANVASAADWLRGALPFGRMRLETDAVTAAKGALGNGDGIVAALGTGSVFAIQSAGHLRCLGGWGLVLGDEGSGAWLGRAALARALKAVDGLVPMTPLLQGLLHSHGGPSGVVAHARDARPADFATLAPAIMDSADPAAEAIRAMACADVRQVLAHLRAEAALPVTFIGGLGAIYAGLLADLPQRPAQGTALDGALLLAQEVA